MSRRRCLADMLIDVAANTLDALPTAPGLRVRQIALTLPVEVGLHRTGNQLEVLGDLPRLVTRTAFDVRPGRICLVLEGGEPS